MIRKKLPIAIVLLSLLLSICSCSKVDYKSVDCYAANSMDKLASTAGENIYLTIHQKTSELEADHEYTIGLDENGEKYVIYVVSNGYEQILEGGRGYGYNPDIGKLFLIAHMDDTYESEINYYWNNLPFQKYGDYENDDQRITNIEKKGDDIIVSYDFPSPEENAEEGSRMLVTDVVDSKTLFIKSSHSVYTMADGTETMTIDATAERNKAYTIDEKYKYIFNADNKRTVTVIVNPGTAEEQTQIFTLPVDVTLRLRTQPEMAMYADAACTTAFSAPKLDENGNYPLETTIYISPAKK